MNDSTNKQSSHKIHKFPFGKLADGTDIFLYKLKNCSGMEMQVINYGGIIIFLKAPDKQGKLDDVVLGYDFLSGYEDDESFFGALIGRYANRIAKGHFSLDGVQYNLFQNNMGNHLPIPVEQINVNNLEQNAGY